MTNSRQISDVEQLIEEFQQSGMRELHVRADGFELYLSTNGDDAGLDVAQGAVAPVAAAPAPVAASAAPAAAPVSVAPSAADVAIPDGAEIIRAPYLGTFYRSPKPGSPVYVDVGSEVTPETEMCLVEVMKLFTAVRAGVNGRVHQILATDGQMVQADQPLFVVVAA
ncbi:acetyl-CoA carboxylase biotin carboxyl carrier protein [Aquisediminimonas sediminicola]|uniref:acetyl-CoA carboxylase biotin carboxyl carrier protein n=1 Tax=Alteraquisediminimonas sediminicola TaxID=2676787 RepID=UPI001C8D2379|nr:acetyl-CoA carboxylase biotin carboxyl carrier protein [Aquisediminimonas sediminicola]